MNYYTIKEETYKAYEYLIDQFMNNYRYNLQYRSATVEENEELIADEIYTHFGTHYYKCINALNDMKNKDIYLDLIENENEINILDIGCNVGTATYAYIDTYLESKNITDAGCINVVFIEMSQIRVQWLEMMFDQYVLEVKKKYKNIKINYHILCESFPVDLEKIQSRIIDAKILILISNFTNWNPERELAERINDLYRIDKQIYLLNIETKSQLTKITNIVNYMKQYKIYDISGPTKRNNFKYDNLECSYWKAKEYTYNKPYYQTNIREQDIYEYINNGKRMVNMVNKTINTLSNLIITDEIELNYFMKNKYKIIDISRTIMQHDVEKIYMDNYMEYNIPKKDGTTRPLLIENASSELISTSIITSIGLCIDNTQNMEVSFGNRIEEKEEVPYVTKKFMEQYFNKFISNQKSIKENDDYKYYLKLDLQGYYKNISHRKLLEILDDFLEENTWFQHKEWLGAVLSNYISRDLLDTEEGKGIPQGVPLSGLLSNMYLNRYDDWFRVNNIEDKLFRYVDDMIIFGNTSFEDRIDGYSKFITENLQLKLNTNKTELGKVSDLEFYDLSGEFDEISNLCKCIYNSLYNLPSNIYKLYIKDCKVIIDLLYQCYNSIGINISKSWLAKKIRRRRLYSSGYKINYGKMFGKNNVDINKWKKDFLHKNSKFMSDVDRLKELLESQFNIVYNQIKQGDNSTLIMRRFKFIFNKLGTFTNQSIINEEIFEYVIQNPWLVDLKKFKGYVGLKKTVFNQINNNYNNYCNIICIWLIGEYGAVEYLNDILKIYIETIESYTKELRVINTIACETVLKLVSINKMPLDGIEKIEELLNVKINEKYDYIYIRNMLMLINAVDCGWIQNNDLKDTFNLELKYVVNWIRENLGENIIELLEPMYDKYGEYLPDEEPVGDISSRY